MTTAIKIRAYGASGPFSRRGECTGYEVTIGPFTYLIDCGAPFFQKAGGDRLKAINGFIVTHSHEDHKRWFTELALYNMYCTDFSSRIALLTSEPVHKELIRTSGAALDRSLSIDSKNVIDIPFENYINFKMLGPQTKYKITLKNLEESRRSFYISDLQGNVIGKDRAKIIIHPITQRPRLLFKDPVYKEWIEPESFYPFSSEVFYEENQNICTAGEGIRIEAIKSPVWHGISGIGIKIQTKTESVLFSSDTVHDKNLWEQLYSEKRIQKYKSSRKEFDEAYVIYDDINNYIERTWSEERYKEALLAFKDSIVIHDIALKNSVVHTDYDRLEATVLEKTKTILTHTPDSITSEWALLKSGTVFVIKGGILYEIAGGKTYTLEADIYHKEAGENYVGYRDDNGEYLVYERDKLLSLSKVEREELGAQLYRVNLYRDMGGRYFPAHLNNNPAYQERPDGRVELVEFSDRGSTGKIAEDCRDRLTKKSGRSC